MRGGRKSFVEEVAEELGLMGVGFLPHEGEFFGDGLEELLEQLDTVAKKDLVEVVRDFEKLPERILENKSWWEKEKDWSRFRGPEPGHAESPYFRFRHLFQSRAGRFPDDYHRSETDGLHEADKILKVARKINGKLKTCQVVKTRLDLPSN